MSFGVRCGFFLLPQRGELAFHIGKVCLFAGPVDPGGVDLPLASSRCNLDAGGAGVLAEVLLRTRQKSEPLGCVLLDHESCQERLILMPDKFIPGQLPKRA